MGYVTRTVRRSDNSSHRNITKFWTARSLKHMPLPVSRSLYEISEKSTNWEDSQFVVFPPNHLLLLLFGLDPLPIQNFWEYESFRHSAVCLDGGPTDRKAFTYTAQHKQKKHGTYIHAPSGIRTHDPSVRAIEGISRLRLRPLQSTPKIIIVVKLRGDEGTIYHAWEGKKCIQNFSREIWDHREDQGVGRRIILKLF
jgi:hypothetical protein